VCQVAGTRSDVFPPVREDAAKAQDVCRRFPSDVREAVERELGKPIGAVFSEFAETPIASASLAQVHAARLLDGTEVAVKVQYPDIDIVRTWPRCLASATRRFTRSRCPAACSTRSSATSRSSSTSGARPRTPTACASCSRRTRAS
jgi:hypothetical protein